MNKEEIIKKAQERLFEINPDPYQVSSFLVPVDKGGFLVEPPEGYIDTNFYTVRFDYDFVLGSWVFRYIEDD